MSKTGRQATGIVAVYFVFYVIDHGGVCLRFDYKVTNRTMRPLGLTFFGTGGCNGGGDCSGVFRSRRNNISARDRLFSVRIAEEHGTQAARIVRNGAGFGADGFLCGNIHQSMGVGGGGVAASTYVIDKRMGAGV